MDVIFCMLRSRRAVGHHMVVWTATSALYLQLHFLLDQSLMDESSCTERGPNHCKGISCARNRLCFQMNLLIVFSHKVNCDSAYVIFSLFIIPIPGAGLRQLITCTEVTQASCYKQRDGIRLALWRCWKAVLPATHMTSFLP